MSASSFKLSLKKIGFGFVALIDIVKFSVSFTLMLVKSSFPISLSLYNFVNLKEVSVPTLCAGRANFSQPIKFSALFSNLQQSGKIIYSRQYGIVVEGGGMNHLHVNIRAMSKQPIKIYC